MAIDKQPFDELQQADIRVQFRHMYADLGLSNSLAVLNEIVITASILAEVISEEYKDDRII